MKKKLLVVGDSFMCQDPRYPGQHWSELLPAFDVVNLGRSGWSNCLIALSAMEYVSASTPDAVVLGFTDPLRLEFAAHGRHGPEIAWVTSNHTRALTADEKLCRDYFSATRDLQLEVNKSAMLISNLLGMLQALEIPFAFNYMMFETFLPQITELQQQRLSQFQHQHIPYNLAIDNPDAWSKSDPMFHVDDINKQKKFAMHAEEVLTLQFKSSTMKQCEF
jgi:hypothetical protein